MEPTPRCPLCYKRMVGDVDAGIAPGDRLADHLTDVHDAFSPYLKAGVIGDV